jgi:hypothetical protein
VLRVATVSDDRCAGDRDQTPARCQKESGIMGFIGLGVIKILILVGLIRLLLATSRPFLCSGIYTVIAFGASLALERGFMVSAIVAGIAFATSSLYFWLLNKFEDSGVIFFIILIVGLLIGLV